MIETLTKKTKKESYYILVAPLTTDEHGRAVQDVFKTSISPNDMDEAQRAQLQSIATIIHTSPEEKRKFPDAPRYMVHIPGEISREEKNSLLVSIDKLVL